MRRGSLWSAALCVLLGACGSLHSAQEIRGRTIDAATGDPVAGVIVVAQWEPFQRGIGHAPGHREVLHVYETLTGADGRYVIPAWGPKPLPFGATMEEVDPALLFFKPGYVPVSAMNTPVSDARARNTPPGVSEWHGKDIRLARPTSTAAYADRLGVLSRNLREPQTHWKSYPRMVYALWQEEKRLPPGSFGYFSRLPPIDVERLDLRDKAYLEERGK